MNSTKLDLAAHLQRQRAFSFRTFGQPNKPRAEGQHECSGVIDHLYKELTEIAQNHKDVEEWIDIAILAFDGALRAGYSPHDIVAALIFKQAKNERRNWPDWRTSEPGKAIEHIRAQDTTTALSAATSPLHYFAER